MSSEAANATANDAYKEKQPLVMDTIVTFSPLSHFSSLGG